MEFAAPDRLFLLALVPVFISLAIWGFFARRRRMERFMHQRNIAHLGPRYSMIKLAFKVGLAGLALGLIVLALAGPRWGFEWKEVKRRGVDIMIALDVSQSMLAEDIKPNRLKRARREIIDLIEMLKGDRIGLIAFAGVGFVQCPLTTDYKAVEMFLSHLDEELIPVPGTSLGDALRLGVKSLQEASGADSTGKAIILITDGEDQNSDPLEEAQKARQEGVKVFTIGMGQDGGAPIPLPEGGFKKDAKGNVVVTKLDAGTLKEIADITAGDFVRSTTGDLDLRRIYLEGIKGSGMKEGEIGSSRQKLWHDRSHLVALLAFVLLFISYHIPETQTQNREGETASGLHSVKKQTPATS